MKRALLALIIILTIGVVMSLHDVDKTSSNRITSILNSADDVQQRMAQGTSQVQNAGEEESDGLRTLERQIIAVQDGTNKAVFGFYGEANKFGFKVAEDGVDVLTASDDQLLFNSEQNVFKIAQSGDASGDVASLTENATDTTTIPHNLGFVPAAIVYVNGTGSTYLTSGRYYPTPTAISIKIGTVYHPGIIFEYEIDDTNLYLTVTNRSTASPITDIGTVSWKYYLLQETAN